MLDLIKAMLSTLLILKLSHRPFYGLDTLTSANYLLPAVTTGLAALRRSCPQFNITHRWLVDPAIVTCAKQREVIQDLLAKWYYLDRRPRAIPIILLGGGCQEAEYANQLANAWNVLYITTASVDATIRRKSQTPTWVTTSAISLDYGNLFKQLLQRYQWSSLAVIVDPYSININQSRNIAGQIQRRLQADGFKVLARDFASLEDPISRELLAVIRESCRVVIYCGGARSLRNFFISATDNNMTDGEYVYLAVTPFDHPSYGKFHWQEFDNDDEKIRAAYRSLLLLKIYEVSNGSNDVADMLSIWKNLAEMDERIPANLINNLPLPYLSSTHMAFQLVGQVVGDLNSTVFRQPHQIDGTQLARRMINKTFTIGSEAIAIDSLGVRLVGVTLQQFSSTSQKLETILIVSETLNGTLVWQYKAPVSWFGRSSFPPNEPPCGYLGQSEVCIRRAGQGILVEAIGIGGGIVIFTGTLVMALIVKMYGRPINPGLDWWMLEPDIRWSLAHRKSSSLRRTQCMESVSSLL
ncbi:hypothetical protein BV898_00338 [Hypsibius exemplaris]|uniref:Receptor ligand binding region domain-containing protein n=1 Tax=Hypsibius exemplaris TaxID=2072580 RepID=A0A1W0XFF6_HYPEX|nr:hypothetical protein BV898_00338 [Hypsibius exemplaris]